MSRRGKIAWLTTMAVAIVIGAWAGKWGFHLVYPERVPVDVVRYTRSLEAGQVVSARDVEVARLPEEEYRKLSRYVGIRPDEVLSVAVDSTIFQDVMAGEWVTDPNGMPRLLGFLKDRRFGVRMLAAGAMVMFGREAAEAEPALVAMLADGDAMARRVAAAALANIGRPDTPAPKALEDLAARDPNEQVRRMAGDAAQRIRKAAPGPAGAK